MSDGRRVGLLRIAGAIAIALLLISPSLVAQESGNQPPLAKTHVAIAKRIERGVVGITAQAPARKASYFGTGAFISEEGHILTSITVVPSDCTIIKVIFPGGRRADATLVGTVDSLELSLIKVEGKGHPAIPLGESGKLRLGETVYTFGNCFSSIELDDRVSLSRGAVSGFYDLREKRSDANYLGPCVEITAALNPGVDGGPLVDERGAVIGLLCLNYSSARWLGTAIPVDALKPHLKKLMGSKEVAASAAPVPVKDEFRNPALAKAAAGVIALEVDRKKDIPDPPPPANRPKKPQQPQPNTPRAEEAKEFRLRPTAPVSAFLISSDGLALTSYYNVAGELNGIKARLPGGKSAPAKLIGWDESKDIALIRIEGKDFPLPVWAEDRSYRTGDAVYCLGKSPDPLRLTLTEGIVSSTARFLGDCIQLDAKINYGSVGGPVVNARGEVIGIASHVTNVTDWGQSSGIGFATTWTKIRAVLDELKAGKQLKRPPQPFLGVQFDQETTDIDGVRISEVTKGSAAEKAGIQGGDIVTEINEVEVREPTDLAVEIRKFNVGDKVTLKIERGEKELELTATLLARPEGQ
ncbi:MAG: hypothetical protein A2Z34_00485 [Planctomycetes bacterium RBG_16_59_8]|nr:MAG: hypothetical protein A2Z34_00485 [Planctomycetes bacterium RBG_16_59_8]